MCVPNLIKIGGGREFHWFISYGMTPVETLLHVNAIHVGYCESMPPKMRLIREDTEVTGIKVLLVQCLRMVANTAGAMLFVGPYNNQFIVDIVSPTLV